MTAVPVEPLRPSEAVAATELMRRSFYLEWIEHGTLRCSGYSTYLMDQLATPLPPAVDAWTVREGQDLEGVLVANRSTSSSHLVYLAVARHARGRGIGPALVSAWVEAAVGRGYATLTLDVVASNTPASRLYSKAGFARVASRGTMVAPLAQFAPIVGDRWWSDDLTRFLGTYQRYGFGQLRLKSGRGHDLSVGVLDSGYVRHPLTDELRSAAHILQRLLPQGNIVTEGPADPAEPGAILRLERRLSTR